MKMLVGVFLVAALCGCQNGRSVVGTWSMTGTLLPNGAKAEATFGADGKAKSKILISSNGLEVAATVDGNYSVRGDEITMTIDDVSLTDFPPAFKQFEGQAKDMISKIGQQGVGKLKWDSDNQFTIISDKGPTTTFKKK